MPNQVLEASNYSFNIFAVPTIVAAVSLFLLGVFVLARERITHVTAAFFLLSLTVTIWLLCFSGVYTANKEAVALWWAKAAYLGIPFIAPATYLFTVWLLGIYREHRYVVWGTWIASGVFAWAAIGTDALVTGMTRYWWGYYTSFGWLGFPFILYFGVLLISSMVHYVEHYRILPQGTRKQRVRWLMLAFGIGYAGIVDFIPAYGIPLYPFGYLFILGFVFLSARAIWAYHLPTITLTYAANEIIDTMGEALLVLDAVGIVRVANRAACDLFESARGDLVDKPVASAIAGASFGERLQKVMWNEDVREYEMEYANRLGERRILSTSATIAWGADDEPIGVVCVVRDITVYREAEEEIRHLNENLEALVAQRTAELEMTNQELEKEIVERKRVEEERAQLLISEQMARAQAEQAANVRQLLLSVVSHDLRNPLSAMRGSTLYLQNIIDKDRDKGLIDKRLESGLLRIENSAKKMNRLIDELLDLARLQAGQPLELYRQDLDVVELARTVIETHQQYTTRHSFVLDAPAKLRGTWDPQRIERALDNLVSNAIKFSPRGGEIRIAISEECGAGGAVEAGKGEFAVIKVRDEGMGIPAEDLPYIFEWFHRATNVLGRISGTGIGLATVRQTLKQHGGDIIVSSAEGEGTEFTMRLPLASPGLPIRPPQTAPQTRSSEGDGGNMTKVN